MTPYFETAKGKLYCGDCLEVMRTLSDNYLDMMITDPPYGLAFMGKKWDYDIPSVEIWRECLRVLKPGAHALIFAGSRTQHRMAVNVEDAGFILKDCLMWLYGSGFPKSTDISKQIDKMAGKENIIAKGKAGKTALGQSSDWNKTKNPHEFNITAPATPEAELWNGWGTHLKPSYEPLLLCMKPNDGSYAQNALKYGVAGLNIDGGRIDGNEPLSVRDRSKSSHRRSDNNIYGASNPDVLPPNPKGRFPANIILDEEAGRFLDEQSGFSKSSDKIRRNNAHNSNAMNPTLGHTSGGHQDSGGASRFFYCAKASKSERNKGCQELDFKKGGSMTASFEQSLKTGNGNIRNNLARNNHPTVKPLKLIEYLCNLLKTPTGGIMLDPFAGSGTHGVAARNVGLEWVLIERETEYCEIAAKRIEAVANQKTFDDYL